VPAIPYKCITLCRADYFAEIIDGRTSNRLQRISLILEQLDAGSLAPYDCTQHPVTED
jgi:hypothetical protein